MYINIYKVIIYKWLKLIQVSLTGSEPLPILSNDKGKSSHDS